jgi:hypothetical protein
MSGKKPFEGLALSSLHAKVWRGGLRPSLKSTWPKEFCAFLQTCWRYEAVLDVMLLFFILESLIINIFLLLVRVFLRITFVFPCMQCECT